MKIFHGYGSNGMIDAFIDEEGKHHYHNYNPTVSIYRCTDGHELKEVLYNSCAAVNCSWSAPLSRFEVMDGFGFL